MKEYIVHVPKHLETNQEKIVSFFGEPIIELIRCKDCNFSEMVAPDKCYCEGFLKAWVDVDDFCAWAYPKVKKRFGIKRYTQSDSFCSWAEPKEADG